jgi:hypothetical protein
MIYARGVGVSSQYFYSVVYNRGGGRVDLSARVEDLGAPAGRLAARR